MNSRIQKFDIGFSLDEKLTELTTERGMTAEDAMALIMEGVDEWVGGKAEPACVSGDVWVIDSKTYRITSCNRRDVPAGEQWFEAYVDAIQCLASLARR